MACGLKTMAVEFSASRIRQRVCTSPGFYHYCKRRANRSFRRRFKYEIVLGLEAWSEFNPKPTHYCMWWHIG